MQIFAPLACIPCCIPDCFQTYQAGRGSHSNACMHFHSFTSLGASLPPVLEPLPHPTATCVFCSNLCTGSLETRWPSRTCQ